MSPMSDEHQFSPNVVNTESSEKAIRINLTHLELKG